MWGLQGFERLEGLSGLWMQQWMTATGALLRRVMWLPGYEFVSRSTLAYAEYCHGVQTPDSKAFGTGKGIGGSGCDLRPT